MGQTAEAATKLELVDDPRNEVLGEFVPTDIVSVCNMNNNSNTGQSSKAQNEEFHLKRQKFLKECLEKDIFLEGLITSVFMDDNNLTDVCESGITKASHFSELGDLQTLMSAVSQWCNKLHTRSGKKKSQQVAWFNKNGLKRTIFKEIDEHLRDHYTEVVAQVSDLKKPTTLNFNKDVQLVHETMTETIAKLWYNRLCIYQGHKDLGYMQISSKVPGLIGRKSCYRLTNEPPRFVLALDALTRDHIPKQLNLLVSVGEDLVASILSKYHNTTPKVLVDQFFCIPVATEYMSFELGSLASSEQFCKRLKLISGHVIKISYDRDLKQLRVLCPKVGCDRVRSVMEEELKNLQRELQTTKLELPFPNSHSHLRIQIGEGLQCLGMSGSQWFHGRQKQKDDLRKRASISDFSEAAEISSTHEQDGSCAQKERIEDLCDYQHFTATEDAVEYECYTESQIAKQTNILIDDIVEFDSSVEVILNCLIEGKDERNGNGLMSFKDAKTFVIAGVIWAFAEAGLRTDGRDNNTAIWAQTNSGNPKQFQLKLVFPNVHTAVAGARCIESISRSNFSVCLRHPAKLATDLNTIRVTTIPGLYQVIGKPLQELLDRMQQENVVESWIIKDLISTVNHSSINLQTLVSVTATENRHIHNLTQTLEDFFQPAKATFDNLQLHYLQSNEGTKFLKFLMHFTKTYIYLPEFHKKAYIYGNPSNKNKSASILKRQLVGKADSCGLSWHLFDFDKTCFNSHALTILYHDMRSCLDKLKCNSDISQYFLFEDRPELWLETKADVFGRYSEETNNTLLQGMDILVEKKHCRLACPVCKSKTLETSNKDCYLVSVCGHAYCRECLLKLVTQAIKDRKMPVKCVFEGCYKALSAVELWYICGVVQYYDIRKILRNTLKNFIMDHSDSFRLCVRPRCGALCVVYEQDKMKACMLCQGIFCLQCDGNFHGTKTCDEVWNIKQWLREDSKNRKRCNHCRIAIQKEYGCNVVFCAWCKRYICWSCGRFHSASEKECSFHVGCCRFRDR